MRRLSDVILYFVITYSPAQVIDFFEFAQAVPHTRGN